MPQTVAENEPFSSQSYTIAIDLHPALIDVGLKGSIDGVARGLAGLLSQKLPWHTFDLSHAKDESFAELLIGIEHFAIIDR